MNKGGEADNDIEKPGEGKKGDCETYEKGLCAFEKNLMKARMNTRKRRNFAWFHLSFFDFFDPFTIYLFIILPSALFRPELALKYLIKKFKFVALTTAFLPSPKKSP